MRYPGLAYVGSGKISGLYGLNETIHDQKSMGLQHLYIDSYEYDFIYSAMTVVQLENQCFYGDQVKPKMGHPIKRRSNKSYCLKGYHFFDEFNYEKFNKTDSMFCSDDYSLIFDSRIDNKSDQVLVMKISCLIVTTDLEYEYIRQDDQMQLMSMGKIIKIETDDKDLTCRVSSESPSGFMYKGIQNLLYDENEVVNQSMKSKGPLVVSLTKEIILEPNETYTFRWAMNMGDKTLAFSKNEMTADNYWKSWLNKSACEIDETVLVNLIALKAINLGGFVPADLTGHYFAGNNVSFYVRDALHGARAFLYSGFYEECKEIVLLTQSLLRKDHYEMYQRYNAKLLPDEGANNNVFSQIDVIGYLLRVVADYEELTGELLVEIDDLMREVKVLDSVNLKGGLYGPEGGVNEGVYGPAYITSTNIFIVGGLIGFSEILRRKHNDEYVTYIEDKIDKLLKAINKIFTDENYYAYGYVEYADEMVKRYDTPQLFGASLGYPLDSNYIKNFYTLTRIATYYEYGYGYSEQQYHDGPWVFNTAFAAQNAYLFEDSKLYNKIMTWLEEHKNDYGLLPEAVDARNEENSYINPLMWANAEYICAKFVKIIKRLRIGES